MKEQLDEVIIETAPETPTGERTFYMQHKPVIREDTTTTKVRMVFDASARPHPLANSINDCMYTGPPLQPLLWDIMIRTRMSTHILLADIQKAFLQIGIREQDRDAFRFLSNVNGTEQNFRFIRVPSVYAGSDPTASLRPTASGAARDGGNLAREHLRR